MVSNSRMHRQNRLFLLLFTLAGILPADAVAPPPPISPQESLNYFQLHPDARVELVAHEPLILDPVALAFDEFGRMYVVENIGYPSGPGEGNPPAGRIALLEDEDRDGFYEKRTTFADGFTFPNGVLPWKGGVLVTCAPEVLYLKDVDGDGKADLREVWLTGFSEGGSTQLRVSHPTLGLDGWIYLTNALSGGSVVSPLHPDRPPAETQRNDFRFHPETLEVEIVPGQAQFGQTFDSFGRRFICSNRKPAEHVVLSFEHLSRNPHFAFTEAVQNLYGTGDPVRLYPISDNITTAISHAQTFTAACGLEIYRGTALPNSFMDNIFVCDPTGNLVHCAVRREKGASFFAERPIAQKEFLASTDNWFRPVFLANGPGGALYLCDMYRKTIEHPTYLPEAIRKITDFETGKDLGRIYRILGLDDSSSPIPENELPGRMTSKELVGLLDHPDPWPRETARRLLLERWSEDLVPLLREKATSGETPAGRVLALWLLAGVEGIEEAEIAAALGDSDAGVRENGLVLVEGFPHPGGAILDRVVALSEDPHPRVRFQCALALGSLLEAEGRIEALSRIAEQGVADPWTRAAVLTSVGDRTPDLLERTLNWIDLSSTDAQSFLRALTGILGAQSGLDDLTAWGERLAESADPSSFSWRRAALLGLLEALQKKPEARGVEDLFDLLANGKDKVAADLEVLLASARSAAADAQNPVEDRLAAVDFLQHSTYSKVGETLQTLVDPFEPQDLQISAAKALARMPEAEAGIFLSDKDRWRSLTPPVRGAVFSNVLTRVHHITVFLDALERGDILASSIEPIDRNRLLKSPDAGFRERAERIFGGIRNPDRQKVFEDYKPVLELETNPAHGFEVFKVHCAQCHHLDGEGVEVGPDLTGIRTQPPESILLHILIPDHETVPSFINYVVETIDGDVLTGLIASETPTSITLRRAQGEEESILRTDIADIYSTNLSLMPQEMEKNMSRQDLADLIAYLKGDPKPQP